MFRKIVFTLFLIASCVFVNDALESKFLDLIKVARNECFSKFNLTSHTIASDSRYGGPAKAKDLCAIHCMLSNLSFFDEISINEVVVNTLHSMSRIDLPQFDKDFYERIFVKISEFNRNICSENDETNREEKWQNWLKQQKQQIWGTNAVDNIRESVSTEAYQKKIIQYISNTPLPNGIAEPVQSEFIDLIKEAVETCGSKFNISTQKIGSYLIGGGKDKEITFFFYCSLSELDLVDEDGINKNANSLIKDYFGDALKPEYIDEMITDANQELKHLRSEYLGDFEADVPSNSVEYLDNL